MQKQTDYIKQSRQYFPHEKLPIYIGASGEAGNRNPE